MTIGAFSLLRDDFENNVIDPLWAASTSGSATAAETGAQARFTLPSSTAGSHDARYTSTGSYDLTGDSCFITIGTMVATGVAATAYFQLTQGGGSGNALQWMQLSNTLKAQTVVAGVATDRYSVTWSASTYKYLRIRESGGTTFFDSSTNGTSWTNRASIANPIAVTALSVVFGAVCGNVASPGSFRLDEFNVILPAPSSTWRETTGDWGIVNRLQPVTLAATNNAQGVLVTADTMDESTRALGGTLHYFAGPLGSSSGGFLQLTEYASLVLAQASAFPIPVDGRVDLPILVDARYMRLYHRSTDASSHTLREFLPQRLIQADMIQAESIEAINIAAGAITADKIDVINLAAVSAQMGSLHMDGVIDIDTAGGIYQGSGTFASPTTGLKLFNSSGVGKLSGYNAGTEQITLDTDGKLKAGGGNVILDATGISIIAPATSAILSSYRITNLAGTLSLGGVLGVDLTTDAVLGLHAEALSGHNTEVRMQALSVAGKVAKFTLYADVNSGASVVSIGGNATTNVIDIAASTTNIVGGLNVGSATGATAGQILATIADAGTTNVTANLTIGHNSSGTPAAGFGADVAFNLNSSTTDDTNAALIRTTWVTATHASRAARQRFFVYDTVARTVLTLEASGSAAMIGFLGAAAVVRPTVTGAKAGNAALTSVLTALANLGLITDSST
jgi:hypothetical protein